MNNESGLPRRTFLKIGGGAAAAAVAAACAPAASPPAAAPPAASQPQPGAGAAWEQEWKDTVDKGKKEGRLVIAAIAAGAGEKKLLDAFMAAFPGINVETASFSSINLWGPKALQERQAGVYTYDLQLGGGTTAALGTYKKQGMYDPLRPLLFRPDAMDDNAWVGGYEVGWRDNERKWTFGFSLSKRGGVWTNDQVADREIQTVKDMFNPKWKGKMAWADPRNYGYGYWAGTAMRLAAGDATMKQMWVDQAPLFSRDARQLLEWVVKGQVAMAVGGDFTTLKTFTDEGLGKNVKINFVPELTYAATQVFYLVNRAPNPNAAKVFVNWLMTKEGQLIYAKETGFNSARKDIPVAEQVSVVTDKEATGLYRPDHENMIEPIEKTIEMAKDLLK